MHNIRHEIATTVSGAARAVTIEVFLLFTHVRLPRHRRYPALPLLFLAATLLAAPACTGGYTLARHDTARLGSPAWFSPSRLVDRMALDRWSAAVGPPVIIRQELRTQSPGPRTLHVVSWNVALGRGDVMRLVTELRASDPAAEVVLLLQEAFREGPEVPSVLAAGAVFAGKLGRDEPSTPREEIESIAARAGLHLYYVPSMRNGGPLLSDEDRGNAILSSLPLSDFGAIELPFERQRRVAVAATVSGRSPAGRAWRLRLVSTHLDNMVGPRRGWFAGAGFARVRQARALLDHLRSEETVVLGGDFNTWFGFRELAYREVLNAFPDTAVTDRRPTYAGLLRLDHLFFRLPEGWRSEFRRGEQRYGSDHSPLIGRIELP
jgi:endonuclease/exonuclease/phosphatase family metal-dependent hydrolase